MDCVSLGERGARAVALCPALGGRPCDEPAVESPVNMNVDVNVGGFGGGRVAHIGPTCLV